MNGLCRSVYYHYTLLHDGIRRKEHVLPECGCRPALITKPSGERHSWDSKTHNYIVRKCVDHHSLLLNGTAVKAEHGYGMC